MKDNFQNKFLLTVIALLLLLNLATGLMTSAPAVAENGGTGRYQIAAWAAQSGPYQHHSGYFVVDTVTGKVIESRSEVHSAKE
jgi:hypothetical protein